MRFEDMIPVLKCRRQQTPYTTRALSPAIKPQVILIRIEIRMCLLSSAERAERHLPLTQLIQRVSGPLTPSVKRSVRETDHLPPSSVEVKNKWNYTSTASTKLHGIYRSNFVTMPYFELNFCTG
jgi:hypothetical protein